MFKDKVTRVFMSEDANEDYKQINEIVGSEKLNKIPSSMHQTLLKSINRAIAIIKENPFGGEQIQKSLIPKKYSLKYDINNLWRFELSNFWRMLYTIRGNNVEIVSFILEIIDHKEYNRLFGYRNK